MIYDRNSYGSHAADAASNDKIIAGGGADVVHAGLGDDWLDLGAGRDIGEGGAGNDIIETGTEGDIAKGGAGNDRLYGAGIVELATLNAALLEGGAPAAGPGDLLDGGADDDILIAGDTADVLLGEALHAYGAIPVAAFVHGPSLAAARQLAAACEALTDRLEREKARVSAELVALGDAESAAEAYGTALTSSSFARVG